MRTLYLKDRSANSATTIVHDNQGNACYLLTGKWGLRHDALSIYTMQGFLLAEIRQLSLGLLPKFAIYQNRQKIGVIGKSLGFVREFVYIRELNWVIVGNVFTNHYRVFRNNHVVFTMEPESSNGGLYNRLTVTQESDEPVAVLVACVLNHWAHKKDRRGIRSRIPGLGFHQSKSPELGYFKNLNDVYQKNTKMLIK